MAVRWTTIGGALAAASLVLVGCAADEYGNARPMTETEKGAIATNTNTSDPIRSAERLLHQGRFADAETQFLSALKADAQDTRTLGGLAKIALLRNDTGATIQYLKQVYDNTGWWGRRWPLAAQLFYNIGSAYHRQREFAKAAQWYRRAVGPLAIGPLKTVQAMQRQLEAFANTKPYQISGGEIAILPFVALDPLPVVEVMVNGRGPYNFFVDTGAADLILLPELASELGVEIISELTGSFASQKKAQFGLGKIESVSLSSITVRNAPVQIIALEGIEEGFKRPIHGAIGTTVLRQFYSTIDYAAQRLVLRQIAEDSTSTIDKLAVRGVAIPFWLAEQHMIMARGHINQLSDTLFFVDTGLAETGLLISEATREAAGIEIDWSKAEEGMGGGGTIKFVSFTLAELTLGEGDASITKRKVAAVIHDENQFVFTGALGFEVGGVVSHEFFKNTSLTLDFEKMRLIVKGP